MAQGNYQRSNYQNNSSGSYQTSSIPVTETYQGSSDTVSDSYQGNNTESVQMYDSTPKSEAIEVQEVVEEPVQMYQSNEIIEETNTQTEDDSVGYTGPQRPCCGRGCFDCPYWQ